MNRYTTEAALSESYLFNTFNANSLLTQKVVGCLKTGVILTKDHIDEQLLQIKRLRISLIYENVLKAFEDNEVVLIYNASVSMPSAIPFIVSMNKFNKPIAYVFMNNYATMSHTLDGGDHLNCTVKDLYSLMESAYIALRYAKNPNLVTKKLGLAKTSTAIYTSVLMNIFNKEYSLAMDPSLYDKVSFCLSRFFLENLWSGLSEEIILSYARTANSSKRGSNQLDLAIITDDYTDAKIKDFSGLMDFIKTLSPRLNKLTTKYFIECYIRMYKAPAIFGLEVLPYFFFIITSTLIGSFIVRADLITDITKRVEGMNKFYSELTNSVK